MILDENENDVKVAIYYKEDIVHEYLLSNVSSWKDKYNSSALNFTEEPKLVLVFTAHSFNFAVLKEAYINITFNTSTTKEIYELVVENVTIEEKEKKESNETEKEEEKGEGEGEVKIDEEKADDKEEKAEESKSKEEESVKKEEGSQA